MSVTHLNKSHAIISVGSHASYVVDGNDDVILIGGDSTLLARGSDLLIDAQQADDVIAIAGANNVVVFNAPGTLHELANSSVTVIGDHARLSMAGGDTLSVFGVGDIVNASAGLGDCLTIGGNGAGATNAELDAVIGLENGSLLEIAYSTVWASGNNFTATIADHDKLSAVGSGIQIYATGDDDTVVTGGGNQTPGVDDVVHMNHGTVIINQHSSASVFGDNLLVNALGNDAICLVGADDRLVLNSFGNSVTIGQNGNPNAGLDVVQFSYTPFTEPISVLSRSNVRIVGSNAKVTLGGDDQVTLVGFQEQVVDQTGNNRITIGGNGSVFFAQSNNYVTMAAGDTVTMLSNSNLTLFSPDSATSSQYTVHMSSNDSLSIDQGMKVFAPVAAGDDLLLNFDSSDVLQLASHFLSVDDLLAHSTQDYLGRTVVQLDAGADTLTLGIDKATFTTYAQGGLIKFS